MPHDHVPAAAAAVLDTPALRFITCGSVDDGKSTLVGRLLYDSKLLLEDQLAALEAESKVHGTTGGNLDFALLVDGLQAEREQGITIDVAYRFFATQRRRFIVADTPGHEQYTRNMATGASNAQLAIILVDATKGVITQTRRHSYILRLLGVRRVVLAVNKMDLVGCAQGRFEDIAAEYRAMAAQIGIPHVTCIPISARDGDNVFVRSDRMPWYTGETVVEHLENAEVLGDVESAPFRLPVQWVNRPNSDFRGFSGRVSGGSIRPGDEIVSYPSGRGTRVARIVTADGDVERAVAGDSVTIVLAEEIDVSRGDVLGSRDHAPGVSDFVDAHIVWFDDEAMLPGRRYLLKSAARTAGATVAVLSHKININTLERQPATSLVMNEIGHVSVNLERPIVCDPYTENRETGGFILIDPFTHRTVAAGVIESAKRRADDVVPWKSLEVNAELRARIKGQKPMVLWFTGLVGSGRSTLASFVERRLCDLGRHTYLLDGHSLRYGLSNNLGFSDEDRVENVRRAAEVSKLFYEAGLIVVASLVSPFRADRDMARTLLPAGGFIEIHVSTPLAECERRLPDLYRRARSGEIPNFTGIHKPYEPPMDAEIVIDTTGVAPEAAAEEVIRKLGIVTPDAGSIRRVPLNGCAA